jgi:hypothetical protein
MAQFLTLSEVSINLEAVSLVWPRADKAEGKRGPGCTLYLLGSGEPYVFYGEDAEKVLAFVRENAVIGVAPKAGSKQG